MISQQIRPSSQIRRLSRRAADMAGVYTPSTWTKVAAVSGAAAVGLGAYGAHAFKPENPVYKEVWRTGNLYHLVHSAALLASPLVKRPDIYGSLLTFGIVAFSGSCYLSAAYEERALGVGAPFGGFAFIGAWLSAAF
ncbi:unnamed protein product [Closterium sp. NIES-64]|nr:unnamed protein product [Closterium sp. NIES-64]CAI6010860.1 unnamed protein product [Closterium sp. NIES-65]